MQVENNALYALTNPSKLPPVQAYAKISNPADPVADDLTKVTPDEVLPKDLDVPEVTLDGLKKAWGTDNPIYDLTGDGTVNIADLLQFLASAHGAEPPATPDIGTPVDINPPTPDISSPDEVTPPTPDIASPDGVAPPTPEIQDDASNPDVDPPADVEVTLDGFDAAWGTDNADYDLNADGVVNVSDLLQFLAEHQPPAPVEPTLEGFSKAWGSDNAAYDIDGNGTVNINDLLQFLGNQQPGVQPTPAIDEFLQIVQAGKNPELAITNGQLLDYLSEVSPGHSERAAIRRADALSRQLIDRFEKAGFTANPPSNIRELAGSLGLDNLTHQILLNQLQARYPDGLGLNVFG